MASFHDQWMDAISELRAAQGRLQPYEFGQLSSDLTKARLLIDEDNDSATQLSGGVIIREVRLYVRAA